MRQILAVIAFVLMTTAAVAVPRHYSLDTQQSKVAFAWDFGKDEVRGAMPVLRADLTLDFDSVAKSHVVVAVDVQRAEAGFPFASQAMKGPKVLDAKRFPQIRFASTRIRRQGDGAVIEGNVTVRGVTRPMQFEAAIYRQRGTDPGDLTRLAIMLTGAVNRSEFGASGWPDLVGDQVRLHILAYVQQDG